MLKPSAMRQLGLSCLCLLFTNLLFAQETPQGLDEAFAVSQDRRKAIEALTPGSEPYYFYRCLERQQAEAFAEVPAILAT